MVLYIIYVPLGVFSFIPIGNRDGGISGKEADGIYLRHGERGIALEKCVQ